jgi:hypothetical protein
MSRVFDGLPTGQWVCWDRPPMMYVCYDSDGCSYYPMDTGIESHGPLPLFSWEYTMCPDGRGGIYVTGGHDENNEVRVQDPYSVGHKPPFPDSFFGPMISELWRYDVRNNRWEEVDQQAWGPRQCVAARHSVYDPIHDCIIRTAACREGHSPRPPVPLRGWGTFGFWKYDISSRRWTWMRPFESIGPLTYDTRRNVVLGYKAGRVGEYDVHSNRADLRPAPATSPEGEGAFVYTPHQDLCLFYGFSGQTWVYDIDANEWTRRRTRLAPTPRRRFGFALDPDAGTAMLFGGVGKTGYLDDTWLYDMGENRWTQIDSPLRPEGRFWAGPGIVFEPATRAFVMYGGLARYPRVKARFATGDVWVFKLPDAQRPRRRKVGRPVRGDLPVPTGLVVSVRRSGRVELTWDRSPEAVSYRVRRVRIIGDDRAVAEKGFDAGRRTRYIDDPPSLPKRHYRYEVQAISAERVESGWSASAGTIPSAPERLSMTPDAERRTITLTWPANPEKGIVGYHIYRWVEPPFRFAFKADPELIVPVWWTFDERANPPERMQWVKVNDKPVRGTRFVDSGLKRATTWYYIRAVNALGVEGHYRTSYSMPVWRWYADARRFF